MRTCESLLIRASVVHMCMRVCVLMLIYVQKMPVYVCVFVIFCPVVTLSNRAGNRRGVQPEQVIKKNPCKMVVLWPSLASSG